LAQAILVYGEGASAAAMSGNPNKIFVGGLPQNCSDEVLTNYFMQYGTITDSVVMKDRETGNSRGFGFVTYEGASSVEMVIAQYDDHRIENKWVEVKRATPRDQMPPGPIPVSRSKGSSKGCSSERGSDRGGDHVGERGGDRLSERGGERTSDRASDRTSDRVDSHGSDRTSDRASDGGADHHGSDHCSGSGRGDSVGGDTRPGDWTCPRCGMNVFASKTCCFKCGTPKLQVEVGRSCGGACGGGFYGGMAPPMGMGGGAYVGGAYGLGNGYGPYGHYPGYPPHGGGYGAYKGGGGGIPGYSPY